MTAADRDAAVAVTVVLVASLGLAGVLGAVAVTPAAAQEDPSALESLTGGDVGTLERIEVANEAIAGVIARIQYDASSAAAIVTGPDEDADAQALAQNLTETYNANNATLERYVNNRTAVSNSTDVIEIQVKQFGETETRYLVAETDADGNVTNSTMVTSTDRTVDGTLVLEGFAAANAAAELETFVDEYAEPGKDVDAALRRRMAQQYAGDVTLPAFGGDS